MAYVDASFGVHARSLQVWVISLGRGPVRLQLRQRINTKSSTEKLVAVSDAYGQVIWTRSFVAALGQIVGPGCSKDNLSTMALLRNGRSNSSRTRIDIRYFFMSDRMAAGEVVSLLPTEQMIADILTSKALVGPSSSRPGPS
jgi:hypothetical protein